MANKYFSTSIIIIEHISSFDPRNDFMKYLQYMIDDNKKTEVNDNHYISTS